MKKLNKIVEIIKQELPDNIEQYENIEKIQDDHCIDEPYTMINSCFWKKVTNKNNSCNENCGQGN